MTPGTATPDSPTRQAAQTARSSTGILIAVIAAEVALVAGGVLLWRRRKEEL